MPASTTAAVRSRKTARRADGATVQEVVRALEEDIIFGRLAPGERLVEDALMRRFAAKRHVVRQALTELERLQVVSRQQNKGACVRDFSFRDVEEIYEMRALLQRRAAELIPLPGDRRVVHALRAIYAEHADAVARGDLRAAYHLNNTFHDTLFAACGNRHLVEVIAHYAWIAHAIRSYRSANPTLLAQAVEEHDAMIAALANGDRETLVRLCVDHIEPSKAAYLETRRRLDPAWMRDFERSTLAPLRAVEVLAQPAPSGRGR
jgi:DNA-binding GntR family transcriptional regulator